MEENLKKNIGSQRNRIHDGDGPLGADADAFSSPEEVLDEDRAADELDAVSDTLFLKSISQAKLSIIATASI